jgi:hypothetical protein
MPTITHSQAIEAHNALLELAKLDNIPAVPTGMAIRRGVRLLKEICEDVEAERKRLMDRHTKRDDEGKKVVAETNPDGSPRAWEVADPEACAAEYNALYTAQVEVKWTIPESFFVGSSPKPKLLIDLGDLLTEEGG